MSLSGVAKTDWRPYNRRSRELDGIALEAVTKRRKLAAKAMPRTNARKYSVSPELG